MERGRQQNDSLADGYQRPAVGVADHGDPRAIGGQRGGQPRPVERELCRAHIPRQLGPFDAHGVHHSVIRGD